MNSSTGPSSLNEADELALDAFLNELHRPSKRPPDLSSQILQALAELPRNPSVNVALTDTLVSASEQVANSREASLNVIPRSAKDWGEQRFVRRPSRWRHAVTGFSLAASLAGITVFSALYKHSEISNQKASSGLLAKQDSRLNKRPPGQAKPQDSKPLPETTGQRAIPRTGIVLNQPAVDNANSAQDKASVPHEPGSKSTSPVSPVRESTVATAMNRLLNEYWTRIGIEPTKTASDSEIATRIETRIGYKPSVINGSVDQDLFTSKVQAEPIAARLIATLTDRLPVSGESKQQMIGEAAETIATGKAFDGLIANWIREGRFAAGAQPQVVGEIVAEHLLDADLACARCHDSPVDSALTQKDYWSFAACFKPTTEPNLFYELPDGRQRAAAAAIPMRWTGLSELGAPASKVLEPSVIGIAHLLQNNPRLAASLANRVWESIYGAPLVSRPSDPLAPPRDDALQQMHSRLAMAIQSAGFDLRLAYRIALNSDSMKRTTPDLFKGDGWVTASEEQLTKEGVRIRTFAAQAPAMIQLPRQRLLSAMSTKLGHDPMALKNLDTLLAQPLLGIEHRNGNSEASIAPRSAMSEQEKVWTLWLTDRKAVEDSWLHWIKDPAQQRQHAFYAASLQPNPDSEQVAQQLQADEEAGQPAAANARLMWALIKGQ